MSTPLLMWEQPKMLNPQPAPPTRHDVFANRVFVAFSVAYAGFIVFALLHRHWEVLCGVGALIGVRLLSHSVQQSPIYRVEQCGLSCQRGLSSQLFAWQDIEYFDISRSCLTASVSVLRVKSKRGCRWFSGELYFDASAHYAPQLLELLRQRVPEQHFET